MGNDAFKLWIIMHLNLDLDLAKIWILIASNKMLI